MYASKKSGWSSTQGSKYLYSVCPKSVFVAGKLDHPGARFVGPGKAQRKKRKNNESLNWSRETDISTVSTKYVRMWVVHTFCPTVLPSYGGWWWVALRLSIIIQTSKQ